MCVCFALIGRRTASLGVRPIGADGLLNNLVSLIDCDISDRLEASVVTPHSFVSNCGLTEMMLKRLVRGSDRSRARPWRKAVRQSQR
jgi:hypothetical protein